MINVWNAYLQMCTLALKLALLSKVDIKTKKRVLKIGLVWCELRVQRTEIMQGDVLDMCNCCGT